MITDIVSQLERDEGRRRSAYQDGSGFWTIGVGVCIDARRGCALTDAEIDLLRDNRLSLAKTWIIQIWPWTEGLDDARFGVLLNMAYEMGVHGLSNFQDFLGALRSGDFTGASQALLQSKWAESEAPARAQRLATQMREGTWQ